MSEREREMTNESISIIIKVGKKSNMKFSHSKAYRALIPEDLDILHRSHPDCHLVIIENIKEDEEDAVRKFIQSFESESDENKEGIHVICLIHANIGFTVICSHLWIQTVHIGFIRHQEFTG